MHTCIRCAYETHFCRKREGFGSGVVMATRKATVSDLARSFLSVTSSEARYIRFRLVTRMPAHISPARWHGHPPLPLTQQLWYIELNPLQECSFSRFQPALPERQNSLPLIFSNKLLVRMILPPVHKSILVGPTSNKSHIFALFTVIGQRKKTGWGMGSNCHASLPDTSY